MALTLTSDQQTTVNQGSVSPDQLPEYFSAAQQTDVPISTDFEAFLILASDDLKISAIQWIQQSVTLTQQNQLRDQLTTLMNQQELTNSQAKQAAYTAALDDFQDFRDNFSTALPGSADIPEVQLFLSDLQSVIDELVVGSDRAFFDEAMVTAMDNYQASTGVTDSTVEELQSWTAVLSQYLT